MNTRTPWFERSSAASGALAVLFGAGGRSTPVVRPLLLTILLVLATVGTAFAQGAGDAPTPSEIKVYEAEEEGARADVRREAADLDIPVRRRSAEALAEDMREAQIITLLELIEMKDDSDPEKPELYLRMADLYWEKAEAFQAKANAIELEKKIYDAEEEGRTADLERYRREQEQYAAKQREWQEKAITLYRRIEAGYPTYRDMDMVLYYLAYNLSAMGRGDEALDYYVRLAADHPDSRFASDALFNVGEYYFDIDEFANANVFYENVLALPESPVYGFAIYKQGWCFYNLGQRERAFQSFLSVVQHADGAAARGVETPTELRKEALKDLVLTYSQVAAPGKAVEFFRTVDPSQYLELSARLADLYIDHGKFEESSHLLQTIIAADPDSYRVLTYQRIIVKNANKRGDKEDTAEEAERLIGLYRKLESTAPAEYVAEERRELDMLLRVMATTYHKEHETTGDEPALTLSRRLYGVYIELFPAAEDAYEIHRNYGVLLYQQKEYLKAVVEFEKVIEMQPEGPYAEEAAYQALLCYYRLIEIGEAAAKGDDATDLEEKEIPDLQANMIRACDRYVGVQEAGEDVPTARFAAAKILYDYNHFAEAVKRFKVIIRQHEAHTHARDAARLLLSSYHLMRDIRNLNRWAEILSQRPRLATGELQVIIRDIRDRAEYNRCFLFEHERRFRRAADCFVGYTQKFPGSALMDKALYYAAVNYDNAHMMERSIEVFVDLYNRVPNSPLAPKSLFAVGKVYHRAAVYDEAARYYEIYAQRHPDDDFVEEALHFASVFRKSLGEYDQAIANYELYLRRFPRSERAPHIFFDIGLIYEKKREWKKVIDHFKTYIKRYGKKGPLDLRLRAELILAQTYDRYRGERQKRRALQAYEGLVAFFNELGEEQLSTLTLAGLGAVAEARFMMGERVLARALEIRITERNIEAATTEKLEVLAEAKAIFEDVYSFEHPHWQIAALNRVGVAYADLADTIEDSPCPTELDAMQCEEYKQENAIKADQIRQSVMELFRKCLDTAREQQWFNRYSEDAEQRLAQIDYTYRFTKEFRTRPVHTTAYANPPAFQFAEDDGAEGERATP